MDKTAYRTFLNGGRDIAVACLPLKAFLERLSWNRTFSRQILKVDSLTSLANRSTRFQTALQPAYMD